MIQIEYRRKRNLEHVRTPPPYFARATKTVLPWSSCPPGILLSTKLFFRESTCVSIILLVHRTMRQIACAWQRTHFMWLAMMSGMFEDRDADLTERLRDQRSTSYTRLNSFVCEELRYMLFTAHASSSKDLLNTLLTLKRILCMEAQTLTYRWVWSPNIDSTCEQLNSCYYPALIRLRSLGYHHADHRMLVWALTEGWARQLEGTLNKGGLECIRTSAIQASSTWSVDLPPRDKCSNPLVLP